MKIKTVVVGSLDTNCYILESDGQALIIDPGADFKKIKEAVGDLKVLKILITHKHFDHIGVLYDIMDLYKVGKLDFSSNVDEFVSIGPFTFKVLKTPGHTEDSLSFYFKDDNIMFVGDFVFKGTVGRCDLPTGDFNTMLESIELLKKYSDKTVLYPGHGPFTTLIEEKLNNPYFRK